MWIFLNDAFVSIVEHHDDPGMLLVRGRFAGDVERALGWRAGDARVRTGEGTDYLTRASVPRAEVQAAVAKAIGAIDYPNFKNSIDERWRAAYAGKVWGVMAEAQDRMQGRSLLPPFGFER